MRTKRRSTVFWPRPTSANEWRLWWLDLVRYAESVGYNGDQPISVFPFRDYVIQSFNENKPFDQFTLEQLAGDLLPEGTAEQKIASGYNRLGMMTSEADVQRPEYLAKYIAERVRNLSGTWLGVTLGCCECHDHKYDPFTSKDFYSLEAFFADIDERGAISRRGEQRKLGSENRVSDAGSAGRAGSARTGDCRGPRVSRDVGAQAESSSTKGRPKRRARLASQKDPGDSHSRAGHADRRRTRRSGRVRRLLPPHRTGATKARRAGMQAVRPAGEHSVDAGDRLGAAAHHPPPATGQLAGRDRSGDGPCISRTSLPHSQPHDGRLTRVDLARWVVSPENPLTARVFVNRVWKLFFGAGIARNLDDHGTQGDGPSHPELLDWLAGQFIDSGWNVKHVVKLIVMSGTYRQSSEPSRPTARTRSGEPMAGAAGTFPSRRGDGAGQRTFDCRLARRKSRRPERQTLTSPSGFWAYLNFPPREWRTSAGDGRYRRSIYTHWQRQYLHPAMLAFDAPTREECTADRPRSNTPLQSLVLMNDPEFVEAALAFAEQIIEHRGAKTEERLGVGLPSRPVTTAASRRSGRACSAP